MLTNTVSIELKNKLRKYLQSDNFLCILANLDLSYYKEYLTIISDLFDTNARFLELGCGHGLGSSLLANHFREVFAIDLSKTLVSYAQCHFKKKNLHFLVGDSIELPFQDASFDAVAAYSLIEFVWDVEKALSEMIRVVKPKGLIMLMSPNLLSPFYAVNGFLGLNRITSLFHNLRVSLSKVFAEKPIFLYRLPKDKGSDIELQNASRIYLANPWDIRNFFKANGLELIKYPRKSIKGKLAWWVLGDWAPGFLIIAKKKL